MYDICMGRIEAMRRVHRFDNFLARMDGPRSLDVPSIEEGNVVLLADPNGGQYMHRYRHAHLTDARSNDNAGVSPMETPCTASSRSEGSSGEDTTYIGCVSDGRKSPAAKPSAYMNTKKLKDKRRKDKFQRFVAHKQNQRTRTLNNQSDADVTPATSGSSDAPIILEEQQQECSATSAVVKTQQQAPEGLDSSPSRDYILFRDSTMSLCYSNESPTSVSEFLPSVILPPHDGSADHEEPPAMGEPIVIKKKIFNFIRVESNNRNLKGIIQQNNSCSNSGKNRKTRQKKNLSWWDDDGNRCKPFTLRTDESFDWDDDSTWNHVDKSNWKCDDHLNDFLQTKLVTWVDKEPASSSRPKNEVTEMDLFATSDEANVDNSDADDDSVYHHITLDKRRRKIIGDMLGYYHKKLGDSVSQVVEATTKSWNLEDSFSMDSIDDAISSMTEDKRMASLFKVDLFDVSKSLQRQGDEEYKSVGDISESTPQACTTASCFAVAKGLI